MVPPLPPPDPIAKVVRFSVGRWAVFGQEDLLTRRPEETEVVHQTNQNWQRLGSVEDLKSRDLQQLEVGHTLIALSYRNGEFGQSPAVAIMPAAHWAKGHSGTIISSAPGTTGCFIG